MSSLYSQSSALEHKPEVDTSPRGHTDEETTKNAMHNLM